jgi:branched-chain amino acid transport system permease protein
MSEPVYRYLGVRAALRRAMVGGVIAAAGLALVPAVVSPFQLLFAAEMLIQCLFALAFNLLFGITGLLSFGQAAYFGVGGYLAALALVHGWTGILGVLLLSTVGAALAGLVLGYCCVRLNEIYFAMLTLAFGQMLYAGAWQWTEVTGGSDGILGVPRPPLRLLGLTLPLDTGLAFYVLVATVVLLATLFLWGVATSPFGLMLRAIREKPERAEFVGIPVHRYRLAAFVLSAACAGLAGALLVLLGHTATPEMLFWTKSAEPVMMSLLGGAKVFLGPTLGVLVYAWLKEWLSSRLVDYWMLVTGLIVVGCGLFFRGGICGALVVWWSARLTQRMSDVSTRDPQPDQIVRPDGSG